MVNITEIAQVISCILKGEGNYVLLSGDEYNKLTAQQKVIEEPKQEIKQVRVVRTKKYREVELGKPEKYDDPADVEVSNTLVYYIPVGDGLYRPTYSKSTFLKFACADLNANGMLNETCGNQFRFLVDYGYLPYDICLATKMKERDALAMIYKTNDGLPPYVKSAWDRCFGEHCEWHPSNLEAEERVAAIPKQTVTRLRELISEEDQPTKAKNTHKVKSDKFDYPPFIHHVMREFTTEPVKLKDYPNTLMVYTKNISGKGKPQVCLNISVIGEWMKLHAPKDMIPFKRMADFAQWMKTIPISNQAFWRAFGFDQGPVTTRSISADRCNPVNERLGFKLFDVDCPASENKQDKGIIVDTDPIDNETEPPNELLQISVKQTLICAPKYSIRTLSRLFSVLEPVASRQDVINLFHIQDDELNSPSCLNNATSIEVNRFCGKQVCYGK